MKNSQFSKKLKRIKIKKTSTEYLIQRCLQDDRKAQYKLYEQYARAMYNVCLRIVGKPEEAEDVLQESFIKAFDRLHTYKASASFGAWLKRITVNTAINHIKKRKIDLVSMCDENPKHEIIEHENDDETKIDFQVEQIKKALQKLPDGFRTIFSLYLLEGYDHREISEIMNISVSTSKSQYARAKRKLIEILTK